MSEGGENSIESLSQMFRVQAKLYKKRSTMDLCLTVGVLAISIVVFLFGEAIVNKLFRSPLEIAMDEATAYGLSLLPDAVDVLESKRPELRVKLARTVEAIIDSGTIPTNLDAWKALIPGPEDSSARLPIPQGQASNAPDEQTATPEADDPPTLNDLQEKYSILSSDIDSIHQKLSESILRTDGLEDTVNTITKFPNDTVNVVMKEESVRYQLDSEYRRATYLAGIEFEKVEYQEDTRLDIEEAKSDALVEIAETKANSYGEYARSITDIFTKIGALVLGIWIVKIFNSNRRMNEERASQSERLANLFSIAAHDTTVETRELLPYLFAQAGDRSSDDSDINIAEALKEASRIKPVDA